MARIIPIGGAPGYFVSDEGRVFSDRRGALAELKPWVHARGGYRKIAFACDGRKWREYVHRIVATAFIGAQPSPHHEVRHLDGNPGNNTVGNLAWGTHAENMQDMVAHGRQGARIHPELMARGDRHGSKTKPHRIVRGERSWNAKLTESQVVSLRSLYNECNNISRCARELGIPRGAAKCVVQGKTWLHVSAPTRVVTYERRS